MYSLTNHKFLSFIDENFLGWIALFTRGTQRPEDLTHQPFEDRAVTTEIDSPADYSAKNVTICNTGSGKGVYRVMRFQPSMQFFLYRVV